MIDRNTGLPYKNLAFIRINGEFMARPYIITVASEKGGVGKTTLATNLAIYLKALAEDLPITLLSFDNHFTVDQMFQLGKFINNNHVGQLFTGVKADELVCMGQYGVNFIPSNSHLFDYQHHITSIDQLALAMNRSALQGILIIDTSPILDSYTRNALHASDRIIVPIKDAPSLENCRHLADFLVHNKRSKTLLKIIPCLIDTRIHFDGPFRNSYQLLKAYAINRGYRCYEGFIAKSPKVETLGTNPTGKIYPVITHARNTEVHLQLTHLARQVYLEYLEQGPQRLNEIANTAFEQSEQEEQQFRERLTKLQSGCLCCEKPLPTDHIWPNAYYLENANSSYCGFIEDDCFLELLFRDCYRELNNSEQQDLLRELLVSPANTGYLLLQKTQASQGRTRIDFYRLDKQGDKISGRTIELKETGLLHRRGQVNLFQLFNKAEEMPDGKIQSLLIRRMGKNPAEILRHQSYIEWLTVFNRILVEQTLEDNNGASGPEAIQSQ